MNIRKFIPRFSLRTLLLWALSLGSGGVLYLHWEPWVVERTFEKGTEFVFAPDGRHVGILDRRFDYIPNVQSSPEILSVFILDLVSGKQLSLFEEWTCRSYDPIQFSSDGKLLSLRMGEDVCVFNCSAGKQVFRISLDAGEMDSKHSAMAPSGEYLLSWTNSKNELVVWSTTSSTMIAKIEIPKVRESTYGSNSIYKRGIVDSWFAPDSQSVWVACMDGTLRKWELPSGKEVFCSPVYTFDFYKVVHDGPDAPNIVTCSDKAVRFFDSQTGALEKTIKLELDLFDVAISVPARQLALSYSSDQQSNSCRIQDLNSGKEMFRLSGYTPSYSSNGQFITTTLSKAWATDSETKIWSAEDGRELYMIKSANTAVFSPDNQHLIVDDGALPALSQLWFRRHAEGWRGILTLPEFWLTFVFILALGWSIRADRRVLRRA